MRKVLMIGWELPPFNSGGLGVACFFLAKSLSQETNLYFSLPRQLPINDCPFKVIFADSKVVGKGYSAYAKISKAFWFKNISGLLEEVLTYGQRLYQRIEDLDLNFDVIHAHDWLGGLAGVYLKEKLNTPLVIHVHATEIERTGNNPNPLIYQLEKEMFERADKIITVSHLTREIVYSFYQIPRDKIKVVPNGIDRIKRIGQAPFYFNLLRSQGYKIVLFVGRFALQKGPDYFLQTLPLVSNYVKNVKYVFLGDGEMMPGLIKQAKEFDVLNKVVFGGFLRGDQLEGVYQNVDLLVVPSVFDPFGLVPLEGIKNDLPVIISKTTGVGDYLNNVLKVDFWDVKKMAGYIIGALKYSPLKRELVKNSVAELPKFNWDDRRQLILETYQSLGL
ncbi:MAG: glycosyltransferase family 4 protein [Patescibacteria group bacterium]|nr:glycosyltransferase family 4 protein [Patescibacteria group bacterium]